MKYLRFESVNQYLINRQIYKGELRAIVRANG